MSANKICFGLSGKKLISNISLGFLLITLLSSCSSPPPPQPPQPPPPPPPIIEKRTVKIISVPAGALISVDNLDLGKAPLTYEFNFSKKAVYTVSGTKTDYLPVQMLLDLKTVDSLRSTVRIYLEQHPFVGVTNIKYPANSWFNITLTPEVLEEDFWLKFIQMIKKDYPKVLRTDMASGIVETGFVSTKISVNGKYEYLRSRLRTKFNKKLPEVKMGVYIETEVSSDGNLWTKYDKVRVSDANLVKSLEKKLGVYYYLNKSRQSDGA